MSESMYIESHLMFLFVINIVLTVLTASHFMIMTVIVFKLIHIQRNLASISRTQTPPPTYKQSLGSLFAKRLKKPVHINELKTNNSAIYQPSTLPTSEKQEVKK